MRPRLWCLYLLCLFVCLFLLFSFISLLVCFVWCCVSTLLHGACTLSALVVLCVRGLCRQPQAFRLVGVNCFSSKKPILNAVEQLPQLRSFMDKHRAKTPLWFVVVFNLPGKPIHNVVYLFARQLPRGQDEAFDRLFDRFSSGDDAFKNTRFKLCAKLLKAPWVLGTAASKLGIERPAILGRKLAINYAVGRDYLEADVDVGSSKIASAIHGLILRGCASIVVVTAFTLEGHDESELPERIVGIVRFSNISIEKHVVDMTESL